MVTFKTHTSPHNVPHEMARDIEITEATATMSKRSSGQSAGRSGALDSFFKVRIDIYTYSIRLVYIHLSF